MASLKSKLVVIAAGTAAAVGFFFAGAWFHARQADVKVNAQMLRQSLPVALDMTLTANDIAADDGMKVLAGDVEYRFTNVSTAPVKLAFPPVKTFDFSATRDEASWGMMDDIPEFAQEQQVLDLAPGQTMTFKGDMFMTVKASYPDAGIGWRGFVLSRPPEARSDEGYCVGTMIPRFFILRKGDKRQNKQVIAERARHIADLRRVNQLTSPENIESIAKAAKEATAADPTKDD